MTISVSVTASVTIVVGVVLWSPSPRVKKGGVFEGQSTAGGVRRDRERALRVIGERAVGDGASVERRFLPGGPGARMSTLWTYRGVGCQGHQQVERRGGG